MLFWIPLMLGLIGSPQSQEPVQPPAAEDQGDFKIGVAVNQVFLSVTARNTDGGFARDLRREDFRILEDGVEQEIVNFTQEAVPIRVVLLIDASGSTRHSQNAIRRAALQFVRSLDPSTSEGQAATTGEDRVAIITFNDEEPVLILNWTDSVERIEFALESIYAKGPTRLYDALFVTFDDLLREVPGKKAVILLTDGIDNSSSVSWEEAVDLAVRSEAIVYVVSTVDDAWAELRALRAQGVRLPRELSDERIVAIKRSLQRLTNLTGGRVLESQAYGSLSEVYAAVADELKNQYYLSYVPSNILRDGKWRSIELRVRRAGAVATTRPGYFAPGAPASAAP